MERRASLLSGDDVQARAGPSGSRGSCTKPSSDGAGRVTQGAVPHHLRRALVQSRFLKPRSETEQWWHTDPSVVRVMGKRLGAEWPGYLVLC